MAAAAPTRAQLAFTALSLPDQKAMIDRLLDASKLDIAIQILSNLSRQSLSTELGVRAVRSIPAPSAQFNCNAFRLLSQDALFQEIQRHATSLPSDTASSQYFLALFNRLSPQQQILLINTINNQPNRTPTVKKSTYVKLLVCAIFSSNVFRKLIVDPLLAKTPITWLTKTNVALLALSTLAGTVVLAPLVVGLPRVEAKIEVAERKMKEATKDVAEFSWKHKKIIGGAVGVLSLVGVGVGYLRRLRFSGQKAITSEQPSESLTPANSPIATENLSFLSIFPRSMQNGVLTIYEIYRGALNFPAFVGRTAQFFQNTQIVP